MSDDVHTGVTGHQLRAGRLLAGLTIEQVADDAGIPASTVAAMEADISAGWHAQTIVRVRWAIEGAGIQLAAGGWVRFEADQDTDIDEPTPYDYQEALEWAIGDLESASGAETAFLARVLRVCLAASSHAQIFDALRTGLHVLICRDMSEGLLTSEDVKPTSGVPEWPDRLTITTTSTGGAYLMRALAILGDEPLNTYRPIGPVPRMYSPVNGIVITESPEAYIRSLEGQRRPRRRDSDSANGDDGDQGA